MMRRDPGNPLDFWSKPLSRRQALKLSAAAFGGVVLASCGGGDEEPEAEEPPATEAPPATELAETGVPAAEGESIKVATIFDETGAFSVYGGQMTDMSRYAVETINSQGGVLGRPLELVAYDTQSKIELYSRYAQEIASDDEIQVTVGCITSASREAARPILDQGNKLLFYPTLYEGGLCDKLVFVNGTDPQQQLRPLLDWAFENAGTSYYVIAADYNYGQISEDWAQIIVEEKGGNYLGSEFIPLEVSEFSSTISKIQDASPEVLLSLLVGPAHVSFYRQFAAAGLKDTVKIISTTFGQGFEEQTLEPAEASGIVVSYAYLDILDTSANQAFKQGFQGAYPEYTVLTDLVAQVWNGWNEWKLGVEKAGTLDQAAVIEALESGIEFEGPGGVIMIDAKTHHNIQDISLAESNDQKGYTFITTIPAIPPAANVPGAEETCDLVANPDSHTQIVPQAAG